MTKFEVGTVINQPAEIVAEALMNPDNFPFWQKTWEKSKSLKRKLRLRKWFVKTHTNVKPGQQQIPPNLAHHL